MQDCVFYVDHQSFNHTNPSVASPYTLDLSVPYEGAVFHELCTAVKLQDDECHFELNIDCSCPTGYTYLNVKDISTGSDESKAKSPKLAD